MNLNRIVINRIFNFLENKQLLEFVVGILVTAILFPISVYSVLIGFSLCVSLRIFLNDRSLVSIRQWGFIGVCVLYSLSIFFSLDFVFIDAVKLFETRLSFVFLPFTIFVLHSRYSINFRRIFLFSSVSISLFSFFVTVISLVKVCFMFVSSQEAVGSLWTYMSSTIFVGQVNIAMTNIGGVHQTYLALYTTISFLVFFEFWTLTRRKDVFFLMFLNVLSLGVLASKIPVLLLVMGSVILLYRRVEFRLIKKILIGCVCLLILLILIPNFRTRASVLLKMNSAEQETSVSVRSALYSCGFDLLKDSWSTGMGCGNEKNALLACYKDKGSVAFIYQYNVHNQYLASMLRSGVSGVGSLLLILIYLGWNSYKQRDRYLFILFMMISISLMTENLFDRFHGVFLFTMYGSILFNGPIISYKSVQKGLSKKS